MDSRAKHELDATTIKLESYKYQDRTNKKLSKMLASVYEAGGSLELARVKAKEVTDSRRDGLTKRVVKDLTNQVKLLIKHGK